MRHCSESRYLWLEHADWFLVEKTDLGVLSMQRICKIILKETTEEERTEEEKGIQR